MQVRGLKQGTQSQGSGTTQRNRVGRDVGVGFRRWGTHVYPWPIHVDVLQKPSQYCKFIICQFKKKICNEYLAQDMSRLYTLLLVSILMYVSWIHLKLSKIYGCTLRHWSLRSHRRCQESIRGN